SNLQVVDRHLADSIFRKQVEDPQFYSYALAVMAIRLEPADMPCGRRTFQHRSLWSTCKTTLASPGGWSKGSSTRRKSGPNCSTGMEPPLTSSRIFTWAECPP